MPTIPRAASADTWAVALRRMFSSSKSKNASSKPIGLWQPAHERPFLSCLAQAAMPFWIKPASISAPELSDRKPARIAKGASATGAKRENTNLVYVSLAQAVHLAHDLIWIVHDGPVRTWTNHRSG